MARRARDVADGLAALGLKRGDRVAVIGDTNLEWILADLGILGAGGITVTIYQSNQPHECQYILADSRARWIFCDTEVQVPEDPPGARPAPGAAGDHPGHRRAADPLRADAWPTLETAGADFAEHPPRRPRRPGGLPRPSDPASFIYTSGTTGNPKGVILTHGNWTYEAEAVASLDVIRPDDLILFFLPMAHSFAKVIEAVWFRTGAGGGLRRVDGQDHRQRRGGEADHHAGGAAHLREGLQRGGLEGAWPPAA